MNYFLYYTSADGPDEDSTWSVYVEEYVSVLDEEPIDGSQRHVSTHPTEHDADVAALRLQGQKEYRP